MAPLLAMMAATPTSKARRSKISPRQRAVANGYRSGLEDEIGADLLKRGVNAAYEATKIAYTPPSKERTYTPDWILPNGIIIEAKGRFMTEDRQKHKFIKDQHPDLDIRFLFQTINSKLSKGSKTTYGMWCAQYGFQASGGFVPEDWVLEPVCPIKIAAIEAAKPTKQKASRAGA